MVTRHRLKKTKTRKPKWEIYSENDLRNMWFINSPKVRKSIEAELKRRASHYRTGV